MLTLVELDAWLQQKMIGHNWMRPTYESETPGVQDETNHPAPHHASVQPQQKIVLPAIEQWRSS